MSVEDYLQRALHYIREHIIPILIGIIVFCIVAISAMLLYVRAININHLDLTMHGDDVIFLATGDKYTEAGASAVYYGTTIHKNDGPVEVATSGTVDTETPGRYRVTYTAEAFGLRRHQSRMIVVTDRTAPVIDLTSDPEHYTLPGETYEEEGYRAFDDRDGDITGRVLRIDDGLKVSYFGYDDAGNAAFVQRDIVYDDRTAPELTLLDVPLEIIAGDPWEDAYAATDDVLGECTDRVSVEGAVDTYVPGEYVLEYTVTDDYDNTSTATRIVTVKPVPKNNPGKAVTGEKIVFLTFDDGPGKYTERLLDILKKYEVPATFFVTAQYRSYLDLLTREAKEGHTVAVHTLTHNYKEIYASEEAFWKDFDAMNDIIEQKTGKRTTIMRFPGGSSNKVSDFNEGVMTRLTVQALRKGYDYYDWNVLSGDAGDTKDPEEIRENILAGIRKRNISVVLCHDIHEYTVDAMEQMIRDALEDGYTFLPITPGCVECHQQVNN